MDVLASLMAAALDIIDIVLSLLVWALVIGAILSWLVAFDVVNLRNRFVQGALDFLNRLTEPLLRPIRRFVPLLGGVDLSPVVLILIIVFAQSFFHHLAARL